MEDRFSVYKGEVYGFKHSSIEQQNQFVEKHNITIKGTNFCLGRHEDMIDLQTEIDGIDTGGFFSPTNKDKTIEEIYNLKENDKWDRRDDKEREYDKQMREQIKKAQARGDISGDSFGGSSEQIDNETLNKDFKDEIARVTEVHVDTDKKGNVIGIDSILARKSTGDVKEKVSIEERRHKKLDEMIAKGIDPTLFSPDDFAVALRGDGSLHATGGPVIKGNNDLLKGTVDGKVSKKLRDARKIYRAEEERLKKEKEDKIIEEIQNQDIEDQKNGKFNGCDLLGTEAITMDMLPESIKDIITKNSLVKMKKGKLNVPPIILLKNYPYSSILNGKYIIPSNSDEPSIIHTENVKIDGKINIGSVKVFVAVKEKEEELGWIVYKLPENNYNVVRLR